MKNVVQKDKCTRGILYWQKKSNFLSAVERKSKLLRENEMGLSLGDDIDEVILVKHAVSLGSGICYATVYNCCTVHSTE